MPLHVICSGCLKRFQVGERFAGMQGPCPNCGTIIDIPKESVKLHDTEDTGSKQKKQKRRSSPVISRIDLEFEPVQVKRYTAVVFGIVLLVFILGCIPMFAVLRSLIGTLGLCVVTFPLVLFGYEMLRDRERIFALAIEDVYRRAVIVAAGYVLLWLGFEYCLIAAHADLFVGMLYLAAFAVLGMLLAHPLLEMKLGDAFLHYCLFAFAVICLRFLFWFWVSSESIRTAAPPPPLLPGM
jgi:predicted RNA-binding Zn-ribbon protein involved in translation (DUF1610 family)